MYEATPIVDEDLLEAVNLVAKSCSVTAQLNISKDIDIVRRVTSPPIVGDVTTSLHESLLLNNIRLKGRHLLKWL